MGVFAACAGCRCRGEAQVVAPGTPYRTIAVPITSRNYSPGDYCGNEVITSKYTAANFVFKNLFQQFSRLFNLYFLFIAVLQVIPAVSITRGVPTLLVPLVFVVAVSAAKEAAEDRRRHRADREENKRPVMVFSYESCSFVPMKWADVRVGMIVKYSNREPIAADTVLLQTSDPAGLAYAMTANLDGESNLKAKQTPIDCLFDRVNMSRRLRNMTCNIACDLPNRKLHSFKGTLLVNSRRYGPRRIPLVAKNLLLRGSQLRNTEWVVGLVVYTGMETKVMMNTAGHTDKVSSFTRETRRETVAMVGVQALLCAVAALLSVVLSLGNQERAWYLLGTGESELSLSVWDGILQFFTFMILFTNFVPISLLVTLDLVKFAQSRLMEWDTRMYRQQQNCPMQVNSVDLAEELGNVDYVLADKTGTLTCNVMEFRKCSIAGVSYGLGMTDIGRRVLKARGLSVAAGAADPRPPPGSQSTPRVNLYDPALEEALRDELHPQHSAVHDFFLHLALNHEVIAETGIAERPGSSPSTPSRGAGPDDFPVSRPQGADAMLEHQRERGRVVRADADGSGAPDVRGYRSPSKKWRQQHGKAAGAGAGAAAGSGRRGGQADLLNPGATRPHAGLPGATHARVSPGSAAEGSPRRFAATESRRLADDPGSDGDGGAPVPAPQAPHHSPSSPLHTSGDFSAAAVAASDAAQQERQQRRRKKKGRRDLRVTPDSPAGMPSRRYRDYGGSRPVMVESSSLTTLEMHVRALDLTYSGSSPDETSLVYAASHFGFKFWARTKHDIEVMARGQKHKVELLHVFPFTSARKRSSVVVRDQLGRILLLCKGADSVMLPRLSPQAAMSNTTAATLADLNRFAEEGLRTLFICRAVIKPKHYAVWSKRLHSAQLSSRNREGRVARLVSDFETNLELLGVTAIEDKLQRGVTDAVGSLRAAGIKTWILTGDKTGTAINIGVACSLITPEMELIRLTATPRDAVINTYGSSSSGDSLPAVKRKGITLGSSEATAATGSSATLAVGSNRSHESSHPSILRPAPMSSQGGSNRTLPLSLAGSSSRTVTRDVGGSGVGVGNSRASAGAGAGAGAGSGNVVTGSVPDVDTDTAPHGSGEASSGVPGQSLRVMQSARRLNVGEDAVSFVDLDTGADGSTSKRAEAVAPAPQGQHRHSFSHSQRRTSPVAAAAAGGGGVVSAPLSPARGSGRRRSGRRRSEFSLRGLGVSVRTVEEEGVSPADSEAGDTGVAHGAAAAAAATAGPAGAAPAAARSGINDTPISFLRQSSDPAHLRSADAPGAWASERRTTSQPRLTAHGSGRVSGKASLGTLLSMGSMGSAGFAAAELPTLHRHSQSHTDDAAGHASGGGVTGGVGARDPNIGTILSAIRTASELSLLSLVDSAGSGSPQKAQRASLPWEGFPIDAAGAKFGRVSQQEMMRRMRAAADHAAAVRAAGNQVALVVDTATLDSVTTYGLTCEFVRLTQQCEAVVCARITPHQKGAIAAMLRGAGKTTLAIGDGANDVTMLQRANIGVGLYGHEGNHAVNAADYAIGHFRYLVRLLLVHGQWNAQRVGTTIAYMFFKAALLVLPQWLFGAYTLFSGQHFYYEWVYQLHNVAYTSLPIMVVGALDRDLSPLAALGNPRLYGLARDAKAFFSRRMFWTWMAEAAWHAVVITFGCVAALRTDVIGSQGQAVGLWAMGTLIHFCVLLTGTAQLCMALHRWTWLHVSAVVLSFALWFLSVFIFGAAPLLSSDLMGVPRRLLQLPLFWLTALLVTVVAVLPGAVVRLWGSMFTPSERQVVVETQAAVYGEERSLRPDSDRDLRTTQPVPRQPTLRRAQSSHDSNSDMRGPQRVAYGGTASGTSHAVLPGRAGQSRGARLPGVPSPVAAASRGRGTSKGGAGAGTAGVSDAAYHLVHLPTDAGSRSAGATAATASRHTARGGRGGGSSGSSGSGSSGAGRLAVLEEQPVPGPATRHTGTRSQATGRAHGAGAPVSTRDTRDRGGRLLAGPAYGSEVPLPTTSPLLPGGIPG